MRILDFAHAAEHLTLAAQCHALKHGEPTDVLAVVRALGKGQAPDSTVGAAVAAVGRYLKPRLGQMQYATFQAMGYPLGSESVESGHKVVMEAQLKGAGMRWVRQHINPMVAVRTIACHDRWAEAWPGIVDEQRTAHRQRGADRRAERRVKRAPLPSPPSARPPPARRRQAPATRPRCPPQRTRGDRPSVPRRTMSHHPAASTPKSDGHPAAIG